MINGLDIYYSKNIGRGLKPIVNGSGLKPISKKVSGSGLKPIGKGCKKIHGSGLKILQ